MEDLYYEIFMPGTGYAGHAAQLAPTLAELSKLEKDAQNVFLNRFYNAKA